MKNTYISSDYHLGHCNILKYDNRPFKSISHMDETIINNHNEIIKPDDDFYFLGDFSFNNKKTEEYLQRLNGNKFFIKGNHDKNRTIKLYEKYGTFLGGLANVWLNGQLYVLCHYSLKVWEASHRGSINLYGHSHGSVEHLAYGKQMDCCITLNDYYPFSEKQILNKMNKLPIQTVDKHKSEEDDENE